MPIGEAFQQSRGRKEQVVECKFIIELYLSIVFDVEVALAASFFTLFYFLTITK